MRPRWFRRLYRFSPAGRADERAESLLRDVLGEAGLTQYKEQGTVTIASQGFPGVTYRLDRPNHNHIRRFVEVFKNDQRVGRVGMFADLDYHAGRAYPDADQVLALALSLRYNEKWVLRMACGTPMDIRGNPTWP